MAELTELDLASIKADLSQYLRRGNTLLSADLCAVIVDVSSFVSHIVNEGLEPALNQLPYFVTGLAARPFLEVADSIVDYHLRSAHGPERDILRKSLLEAYIFAALNRPVARPRYALKPASQTTLVRSLQRTGARNFVYQFLSFHVFNILSLAMRDDLRTKMPDIETFEFYMTGLEEVCSKAVRAAIEAEREEIDEAWASSVIRNVEGQLLRLKAIKPPPSSPVGSQKK